MDVYRQLLAVALFDGGTLLCRRGLVDGETKALVVVEQEYCRDGMRGCGESVSTYMVREQREGAVVFCWRRRKRRWEAEQMNSARRLVLCLARISGVFEPF